MTPTRPFLARSCSYPPGWSSCLVGAFLALLSAFLALPMAAAQVPDPTSAVPPSTMAEPLRRGQPAPWDGVLLETVMVGWMRARIDHLEYHLRADVAREAERNSVLLRLEQARTEAAVQRMQLRDGLWRDRLWDAERRITAVRQQLERERRPSLWSQPLLWYGLGIATAVTLAVAAALAF